MMSEESKDSEEQPMDKLIRLWLNIILSRVHDSEKAVTEKVYSEVYERVMVPPIDFENHFLHRVLRALDDVEVADFYLNMGELFKLFKRDRKLTTTQWSLLAEKMISKA